jgi:ABC-three component (ABC-3C) system Middle Component 1
MTDDLKTPTEATLDWVQAALTTAAIAVDLSVEAAAQLASGMFRGGDSAAAAKLDVSELPTTVRALRIGRYAVLLGLLPETPNSEVVTESLRRYRNQCVIARSYLTPNEALDLQLFLIGPRGSEPSDEWQPLALVVERDERVARKLAWLRPAEASSDEASFADFLKRTFLARPWKHQAIFTMAALDNLNRAAAIGEVPRDTVGEWIRLALTQSSDSTSLVDGLVDAWSKRGQP